ncbi:glycosyltransferase family 2 protein [Kamptonema sp. UHCC 0994]|uniref:glycosyltransferase family 2 protein n=1 Tax=Kamptonema sp. UHCC 0994 TaxID=3031329 RepID=UPI0023B91CF1|nr:glycosyltransferase family 2 protein [Kamptonema sp. UHCC 0994]MDF0552427.1 glycosyltransferase family 2 protein [Kamptonema sp. UHCC 0994]
MSSKVCIVTTVKDPGNILESFIRYHLKIGIAHIFIFFDNPEDEAIKIAQRFSNVSTIPCDERLKFQQKENTLYNNMAQHVTSEVMARQILNAETAIKLAWEMQMDWIIHIDCDELFYTQESISDHFDFIPYSIGQVLYRNFEGVPEKLEIDDYFKEVTLFKKHGHLMPYPLPDEYNKFFRREEYFIGYGNGKAAARVLPGVLPSGVHEFTTVERHPETAQCTSCPVILHYISCGFGFYYRKYQQLGKFSDYWFGQTKIPVTFHTKSRDIFCSGDIDKLADFYREQVVFENQQETDYLIEKGILARIWKPASLLSPLII